MTPTRRLFIGAIVLVSAAAGYAAGRKLFRPTERVGQPIAFNHLLHTTEAEIECSFCHQFYESSKHSGLPPVGTCLECHDDPDVENEELKKLMALKEAGADQIFRKLFRLEDHAYYSHRRHAKIAEIPCETCHGQIAASTAPPQQPLVRITMEFCIDCHEEREAEVDCTRCHR